jgi:polysaccharide export outer membrane protein
MNPLSPRYLSQNGACARRPRAARGGIRTFPLLAVCAILWTGAFGYSRIARAQKDAPPPGSQPAAAPAPAAPESEPKAQNSPKTEASKVDTPKEAPAPAAGTKAAAASGAGKSYIIGQNDVLSVKVWNQAQISGMVDVHLDGMITIPLVGEIKAEGLTENQLKEVITKRLGEVLTAPEVDVNVLKINSKHYRVYGGGVGRPGPYPLVERTTIMDALSGAGGLKEFAKPKIEIRRGKQKFYFNYKDFIKGKNMDKNVDLELQDGDEIIVSD